MPVPGGEISTSQIWVAPVEEVVEDSTIEEVTEEAPTESE